MNTWIIIGIVVSIIAVAKVFAGRAKRKQKRLEEICTEIGHDWSGCKCKRCDKENHCWITTSCPSCSGEGYYASNGQYYFCTNCSSSDDNSFYRCQRCGIEKVEKQTDPKDVAINGNDGYLRKKAIRELTDPDVLIEIVNSNENKYLYTWEEICTREIPGSCTGCGLATSGGGCQSCGSLTFPEKYTVTHTEDLRDTARERLTELGYQIETLDDKLENKPLTKEHKRREEECVHDWGTETSTYTHPGTYVGAHDGYMEETTTYLCVKCGKIDRTETRTC
ncbi:MAG: hypothetical protein LBI15_02940 [Dysgonamonadaceae bacterium]|jgi:hypothetical protein|nr:hypothetical protein [Dysgonamonadaceae bacterium]